MTFEQKMAAAASEMVRELKKISTAASSIAESFKAFVEQQDEDLDLDEMQEALNILKEKRDVLQDIADLEPSHVTAARKAYAKQDVLLAADTFGEKPMWVKGVRVRVIDIKSVWYGHEADVVGPSGSISNEVELVFPEGRTQYMEPSQLKIIFDLRDATTPGSWGIHGAREYIKQRQEADDPKYANPPDTNDPAVLDAFVQQIWREASQLGIPPHEIKLVGPDKFIGGTSLNSSGVPDQFFASAEKLLPDGIDYSWMVGLQVRIVDEDVPTLLGRLGGVKSTSGDRITVTVNKHVDRIFPVSRLLIVEIFDNFNTEIDPTLGKDTVDRLIKESRPDDVHVVKTGETPEVVDSFPSTNHGIAYTEADRVTPAPLPVDPHDDSRE